MGGIADYSGSLLLQMPIAEQTAVQLSKRKDNLFTAATDAEVDLDRFQISLDEIRGISYQRIGAHVKTLPGGDWAVYVLGCFMVLEEEKGLVWEGADIVVSSGVPAGKGVSSSAAIEVATMHAIAKAYGIGMDPVELSLLAQRTENLVVGASCGLMDQLSVNLGRKDHLLPMTCRPHEVYDPIPVPEGIRFFGLDSGVRHAVSGASYGDVRTAAFMAFTVAMIKSGVERKQLEDPQGRPYQGFWANISLPVFHMKFASLIPAEMEGSEFLDHFGVHIDAVTTVERDKRYQLYNAALHPVSEHHRIQTFRQCLEDYVDGEDKLTMQAKLGALMLGSHEGYNFVGLGEPVTNRIVDLVRQWGTGHGISGARVSGGGSGGTVTMMVHTGEGYEVMLRIKETMEQETGRKLKLFEGSSDGAHYIN
jgi:L-arabinokinase